MGKKGHSEEEILRVLREAESGGIPKPEASDGFEGELEEEEELEDDSAE